CGSDAAATDASSCARCDAARWIAGSGGNQVSMKFQTKGTLTTPTPTYDRIASQKGTRGTTLAAKIEHDRPHFAFRRGVVYGLARIADNTTVRTKSERLERYSAIESSWNQRGSGFVTSRRATRPPGLPRPSYKQARKNGHSRWIFNKTVVKTQGVTIAI